MYGTLDISTSGLIVQRTRLAAIASNIANQRTLYDANGNYSPYQKRIVHVAPGDPSAHTEDGRRMGVHVSEIQLDARALRPEWDPGHPNADAKGYVMVPDINPVSEQVNAMEAMRAYEANVVAAETTKAMLAQTLRLLA